jgi:hypothetical protein
MKKIYALLFVVVMVACKNDDPKLSAEQYLTAAANGWIYQSILVTIPGTTTPVDVLTSSQFAGQLAACELDDSTLFTSDGKYSVANNTKCDATEEAIVDTGTWTLNSDKTTLTMTSATDDPIVLTKFSIDGTNLRGDTEFFGLAATLVMKHK